MGTHYKGNKKETNALNTYIKLMRASESINYSISSILVKKGLTYSQFNILEVLYHLGPLCQREIGEKLLKSGGNITLVVDNLEKQGLVKRERDASDRRYYKIILTKQGKSVIEKLFPKLVDSIVNEFVVLNENEQNEFQRMCKLIGIKDRKVTI
ncbi:MAG: MarR family winged helix-turn-helix transcriptional regulator [Syntrophothermus sp.]